MNRPTVVLDACALVPIRLATTLLWLAEAGCFQPLWSEEILDEVERNLPKLNISPEASARRVGHMRRAFGAESMVDGYQHHLGELSCDPKDRHVLAAAIQAGADQIVTFNLKDFPESTLAEHEVSAIHPDTFLTTLLSRHRKLVLETIDRERQSFRNPPTSAIELCASLATTVPMFANLAADCFLNRGEESSPIPALEAADDDAALSAFGKPGDWRNPAQVALAWWMSLEHDQGWLRELTFDSSAWGDYGWAREHLDGRSLASKVIYAVDAPDSVAYLRFVPQVADTARVFAAFVTGMSFLTLRRLEDGTWRVWGLGPGIPASRDVVG